LQPGAQQSFTSQATETHEAIFQEPSQKQLESQNNLYGMGQFNLNKSQNRESLERHKYIMKLGITQG
jgi:hypothetical protein